MFVVLSCLLTWCPTGLEFSQCNRIRRLQLGLYLIGGLLSCHSFSLGNYFEIDWIVLGVEVVCMCMYMLKICVSKMLCIRYTFLTSFQVHTAILVSIDSMLFRRFPELIQLYNYDFMLIERQLPTIPFPHPLATTILFSASLIILDTSNK